MDSKLQERLTKWDSQIEVLYKMEKSFFGLEGTEKTMEGDLFLRAEGKNIEERKANAFTSDSWKTFQALLADQRAEYLKQKRVLELRIKAYEAEYLTYRIEAEMIHKGKGGQI